MTFAFPDGSSLLERLCAASSKRAGKRGDPLTPLLLLAAVARSMAGKPRLGSFAELAATVEPLLPRVRGRHRLDVAVVFWDLRNDGIWEVHASHSLTPWTERRPSRRSLLAHATGGFPQPIDAAIRQDAALAVDVASELLCRFFPTQADTVAEAFGLRRNAVHPDNVDPNIAIEFAPRALKDVLRVLRDDERVIAADIAVRRLKVAELTPWRGLTQEMLWALLMPFGIAPQRIATGDNPDQLWAGYTRATLEQAACVPLEIWVANVGYRPTIPPRARRIRDMVPQVE